MKVVILTQITIFLNIKFFKKPKNFKRILLDLWTIFSKMNISEHPLFDPFFRAFFTVSKTEPQSLVFLRKTENDPKKVGQKWNPLCHFCDQMSTKIDIFGTLGPLWDHFLDHFHGVISTFTQNHQGSRFTLADREKPLQKWSKNGVPKMCTFRKSRDTRNSLKWPHFGSLLGP